MDNTLRVTLVCNAGLLLEYHGTTLLLDGIYGKEGHPFSNLTPQVWKQMKAGEPPFEKIDYLLFTHAHPDHICGQEYLERTYGLSAIIQPAEGRLPIEGFGIQVISTPGHKEDCVCYYLPEEDVLFTGDTLFQESIGRTDLPGGDMHQLMLSLRKLVVLPEQTKVYPGHGYPTSIAHERQYNPYL